MNSHKIDVAIIGAGIAGLYLSKLLEKQSINHIIFEQNGSVGKYGNRIINSDVFKKLDLTENEIIRSIKEIVFYSPSELNLYNENNNNRGYVTNIGLIEERICNSINNKNSIRLKNHVNHIDFEKGIVKTNEMEVETKIIIIASGILQNSFLSPLNIKTPKMVFCFTNEIVGEDIITTILDNNLAHGFYGWIIPLQENVIEVGFGTDKISEIKNTDLKERLFSLPYIKKFKKTKNILKIGGGFIPISMTDRFCGKNWILIGDASGGEPMMGGSIHKAIDEAEIASKVIKMYLRGETNSLEIFSILWNEKFGKAMKKQEIMRDFLNNKNNNEIDNVFQRLKNKKIEGDGLINPLFMNIMIGFIKPERQYKTW